MLTYREGTCFLFKAGDLVGGEGAYLPGGRLIR